MMRTRRDHMVFTEPFAKPWYLGPEQQSARFGASEPGASFELVLATIESAAATHPVFLKEMAYQLGPLLRIDVLRRFRSTFMIRDPAWSLPSIARIWPDFTDEEAGYIAQHRAWSLLVQDGERPIVVDGDDLCRDPVAVAAAWCEAVGIEDRPDCLEWEPGMPADWEPWADWFQAAAESTGFRAPAPGPPPNASPELVDRIDSFRPMYEELAESRLRA
jgi:hypothetical protein